MVAAMEGREIFTAKLVESLYCEAMVLADEARSYFERDDQADTDALDAVDRVNLSCESLRVTTRLMHSIAWLLNQKAYFAGEISHKQLFGRGRALGKSAPSDPQIVACLPDAAQLLVRESEKLFARLARLEKSLELEQLGFADIAEEHAPPVHQLRDQLEQALLGQI